VVGSHSISAVLRDSAIQVFHVHPNNTVVMKKKFEVNHWLQTEPKENPSASPRPDGISKSPSEPVPNLLREDLGVNEETIFNTPKIPAEVYSQLPEILRESCEMFADAIEKDVFLIGAIATISGKCFISRPTAAHPHLSRHCPTTISKESFLKPKPTPYPEL